MIVGTAPPTLSDGTVGGFFIDSTGDDLYGPKTADTEESLTLAATDTGYSGLSFAIRILFDVAGTVRKAKFRRGSASNQDHGYTIRAWNETTQTEITNTGTITTTNGVAAEYEGTFLTPITVAAGQTIRFALCGTAGSQVIPYKITHTFTSTANVNAVGYMQGGTSSPSSGYPNTPGTDAVMLTPVFEPSSVWPLALETGLDLATADARYVNITGDTMTGTLYAPAFEAPGSAPAVGAYTTTGSVQTKASSRTVTVPTGTVAGDVLLMFNTWYNISGIGPDDPTSANGFTLLGDIGSTGGGLEAGAKAYIRVADSSTLGGASLTFTWAGNYGCVISLLRLRNVSASGALIKNGGDNTYTSPTDPSSTGKRLLISAVAAASLNKGASGATNTTGETGQLLLSDSATSGDNYDAVLSVAFRELAAGTSVPATTWTIPNYTPEWGGAGAIVLAQSAGALSIDSGGGGTTFGGKVTHPASSNSKAGTKIPHGSAPSSPEDGDIWTTSSGMFVRINGTTKSVNLT